MGVENEENNIFKSLGSAELVNYLTNLWEIDSKFPRTMATKILKTMPFMYKIAGNLPLIQMILESIIEEQVSIEHDFASIGLQTDSAPWQLGVNMAIAAQPKTYLPKYIFTVTNISKPEQIEDFLPNGKITAVVNFFLEHTMPLESEFEVKFTLASQNRKFLISEEVYAGRLGISATI